jgi:alpha-ketoglutarate-dependent taurine dioxygenase
MHTVHEAVFELINDRPDYAGLLEVVNGPFDANSFVEAVPDSLPGYEVIPSSDGSISVVQARDMPGTDKSKRADSFGFHTDGIYRPQPPAIFILACEEPGTTDTKTVFVDSRDVARRLSSYLPALSQLQFSYIDKTGTKISRPLIEAHPLTGEPVMHSVTHGFAEPLTDSLGQTAETLPQDEVDEAMLALSAALRAVPSYTHSWQKNDVLMADNQAYLHARAATQPDLSRKLSRVWLDPLH